MIIHEIIITARYLENIVPRLTAISVFGNFSLPIAKSEENACSGILNTFCPLEAKEPVRYQLHANLFLIPLVRNITLFSSTNS